MAGFVEITRFWGPEEALCAQSFLRARGIETVLRNYHHQSVAPDLRFALGGIGLMVLPQDCTAVVAELREAALAHSEAAPDEEDYDLAPSASWLWLPIAISTGGTFTPYRYSWGVRATLVYYYGHMLAALLT